MRPLLLIVILASLAGCGVAGQPSHPAQKNTFEHRLSIGAATGF